MVLQLCWELLFNVTNKEQAAALQVDRESDGYEIINHDPPIGPYATKAEALDALRGIKRFYLACAQEDEETAMLEDILAY